jgi:predicted permease
MTTISGDATTLDRALPRIVTALASLPTDAIFGWRQLMKRKVVTSAAVLSLALAIGACTAAFRLVDALFLRPMPVRDPGSLYSVSYHGFDFRTGEPETWFSNSYPLFRQMRAALKGQAEVVAVSFISHTDLTYGSDADTEKAYRQSVSGEMFSEFGLRPALGRLLTEDDDRVPGAKPYAVLSYDYWTARFGQNPAVIGRTLRMADAIYQIVGVAPKGFTGTEPGTMTDIFAPTMMEAGSVNRDNSFWLRIFVRVKSGIRTESIGARMDEIYQVAEKDRAKRFLNFPKHLLATYPNAHLVLRPAGEGASNMQIEYRSALIALCVLVAMVLLIACANVANLMLAQAAAREREMALRVSIGASRWRLLQMVMVESALLGLMAAGLGMLFAWRAAPLVVSKINPPDDPARLVLTTDWAVVAFGLALALGVTLLFGLIPALRASGVKPVNALKCVEGHHAKPRFMYALIAAQVAFCFVVLFAAGLFAATFEKLAKQPTGFSADRLLLLDTVTKQAQPPARWVQMADRLRAVAGVETVALEAWPLLSGTMHNDRISVNNAPPSEVLTFFLSVSPGWLDTMKIPIISGRDFRDTDSHPSVAIVNEMFAKQYFDGANPVGKSFATKGPNGESTHFDIVGLAGNASYRSLREETLPQAYIPMHSVDAAGTSQQIRGATIVVRTKTADPAALSQTLRRVMAQADPVFRISTVSTQEALVQGQTIQERLLANLALFFAGVALLLATVGLYGVLNYSVLQREREIGIRVAVGAQAQNIAWLVTTRVSATVMLGALAGLILALGSQRYVATLLYGVRATDPWVLVFPAAVLLTAVLLAVLPAVRRAVTIDPSVMLRAE